MSVEPAVVWVLRASLWLIGAGWHPDAGSRRALAGRLYGWLMARRDAGVEPSAVLLQAAVNGSTAPGDRLR